MKYLIPIILFSCGDPFATSNAEDNGFYSSRFSNHFKITKAKILKSSSEDLDRENGFKIDEDILKEILEYLSLEIEFPRSFVLSKDTLTIEHLDRSINKIVSTKERMTFNRSKNVYELINKKTLDPLAYFVMKYTNSSDILTKINEYVLKKQYILSKSKDGLTLTGIIEIYSKSSNKKALFKLFAITNGSDIDKINNTPSKEKSKLDYKNSSFQTMFYENNDQEIVDSLVIGDKLDEVFHLNAEGHSLLSLAVSKGDFVDDKEDNVSKIYSNTLLKKIFSKIDLSKKVEWKKERIKDRNIVLKNYPILAIFCFEYHDKERLRKKCFERKFVLMDKYKGTKGNKTFIEYVKYLKTKLDAKDKISINMLNKIVEHINSNSKYEEFASNILKYLEFCLENKGKDRAQKEIPYFKADKPISVLSIDSYRAISKLCLDNPLESFYKNMVEIVNKFCTIDDVYEKMYGEKKKI